MAKTKQPKHITDKRDSRASFLISSKESRKSNKPAKKSKKSKGKKSK